VLEGAKFVWEVFLALGPSAAGAGIAIFLFNWAIGFHKNHKLAQQVFEFNEFRGPGFRYEIAFGWGGVKLTTVPFPPKKK